MRSLALLLFCTLMLVTAKAHSQVVTFSFSLRNGSFEDLMKEVRKNSDYYFVYKDDDVVGLKNLNKAFRSADIKTVLQECLAGSGLVYEIEDHVIVVKSARKNPVVKSGDAQKKVRVLKGKVMDGKGGKLPGVTVQIVGTNIGAATDGDGAFALVAPSGDLTLSFTFVGMESQQVKVKELQPGEEPGELKVVLKEQEITLDDVVVTGIFKKKIETYTGAATTITEKELKSSGNRNLLTTISNIDPSFRMVPNNEWGSDPNKVHQMEVSIRGASSLPDVQGLKDDSRVQLNTPLIILDGFEITLERMVDLDENEVSSITLLKDGSATALYGSRGANGVIVITTKEPETGKLKLSYQGSVNIETPDLSGYHLLNAREKLELEQKAGYYDKKIRTSGGYLSGISGAL